MKPVLYAERGYGAPLKVRTMRLFPGLEECLAWIIDQAAIEKQDDLLSRWSDQMFVCNTPGELMSKVSDKDIKASAAFKALKV